MAEVKIYPSALCGELNFAEIAPSKSILHRLIICAALAGATLPWFDSDDIKATHCCMTHILQDREPCYVNESASTLRFLIPLSLLWGGRKFIAQGRLCERPLSEYACLKDAKITVDGNMISTSGTIKGGDFFLRGDVSSQFVSGLLFALPLCTDDSRIHLTETAQSEKYIELTRYVLLHHGIRTEKTQDGYFIPGNQSYIPCPVNLSEGDWSYAAFFVAANELGGNITLSGLNFNSLQADAAVNELLQSRCIDISQTPDLFPALCVLSCGRDGEARIYNAARLRLKECDRLAAMAQELKKLGAYVTESDDSLTIYGNGRLTGGEVNSHNDHRIAMALATAAACICTDAVTIHGAECVKKSAPMFFEHLKALNANIQASL